MCCGFCKLNRPVAKFTSQDISRAIKDVKIRERCEEIQRKNGKESFPFINFRIFIEAEEKRYQISVMSIL